MTRRTFLGLALIALLPGCGSEEEKPGSIALFMFDASASCKNLREQFRSEFRQKLMRMEGTRVYIDLIGANRVPDYPVVIDVPKRKGLLAQYSEDFDRDRARLADVADAELQALFRQHDDKAAKAETRQPGSATDTNIVLTLSLINLFKRNELRDFKRKELNILTDGIQQSPELDLTSGKLDLQKLSDVVERLDRLRLVPRLGGVSVTVGGLAAGKGKQLSASQIILIRQFWQLYFERSGARFNPASLDGSLID